MAKEIGMSETTGGIPEELMRKAVALKNRLGECLIQHESLKDEESQLSLKQTLPASRDAMKQDGNGNNVLSYEENCPFGIICDFLQALITKKYKKALRICKTILSFEPGNEVANEFCQVLEEMVTLDDDDGQRNGGMEKETRLVRLDGKEDGRGDGSIGGKDDSDSSDSSVENSSDDSTDSSEGTSDEQSSDSASSSETETSSDESLSSSEDEADTRDPLEKICDSVDDEEDSSSGDESDDDDGESETSSASSVSSHDSTSDSEEEDLDGSSALLDTEISGSISHLQATLRSLDIQDTFDMISSLDLEDDEEEEMNKSSLGNANDIE